MDGKIPPDLVINCDQTGVKVVPSSEWTLERRGSARVEVAGVDDKRQVTVPLACTLSGHLLPFQVLYTGKTEICHPSTAFPDGCDIWHTPNHWANSETSLRLVQNIVIPYTWETRKKLDLNEQHMALVIYDTFKGHTGEEMKSILVQNNITSVIVPANCTDLLQPLDLSVNKPFKDHLRHCFQSWYSDQVSSQLQGRKKQKISLLILNFL